MISRRMFLGGVAASLLFARLGGPALAQSPRMVVHKDLNCGCCGAWVDHLRANGFEVSVTETAQLNRIKARLGVPNALASCHTAEIDGFIIEGHVPAGSVRKLLSLRPNIRGLAVPGMPVGSPGMEVSRARRLKPTMSSRWPLRPKRVRPLRGRTRAADDQVRGRRSYRLTVPVAAGGGMTAGISRGSSARASGRLMSPSDCRVRASTSADDGLFAAASASFRKDG